MSIDQCSRSPGPPDSLRQSHRLASWGSIPLGTEKAPRYEVDAFTNTVYLAEGDAVKGFRL
jgi:hypothetical protein